jgi:hypothetical protein
MSEFFVGYLPKIPAGIFHVLRRTLMGLLLGMALLAIVLAGSQNRFPPSVFEFGQVRDFEGVIEEHPYPALLVSRPGITGSQSAYSRYLLVALGKHGGDQEVAGLAGQQVKLRGTLIYRGDETLVEVMPASLTTLGPGGKQPTRTDLGPVTLSGEIVDSKCYFGVMNPAEGKVHRDCATRCLSGGIPPALIVHGADGRSTVYLLANADGERVPSEWAAERTARPITIRGRLVKSGDTLILEADLGTFRLAAAGKHRLRERAR